MYDESGRIARHLALIQGEEKRYAFLVANTSMTYDSIAKMTDQQIVAVLDQFKPKH